MTRFNISLDEGVEMVFHALGHAWGGEIFVPKIPSYRITDLAEAVGPDCQIVEVGIRPGEKLHEEMITATDALNTLEIDRYYVILPSVPIWDVDAFRQNFSAHYVDPGFSYNSGENEHFLSVQEIREQIVKHVDPEFSI